MLISFHGKIKSFTHTAALLFLLSLTVVLYEQNTSTLMYSKQTLFLNIEQIYYCPITNYFTPFSHCHFHTIVLNNKNITPSHNKIYVCLSFRDPKNMPRSKIFSLFVCFFFCFFLFLIFFFFFGGGGSGGQNLAFFYCCCIFLVITACTIAPLKIIFGKTPDRKKHDLFAFRNHSWRGAF